MNKFLTGALGAFIAAAVFLAGDASAQAGDARVRVLHASPDAPAVDVYVDGSEAISNLAFGSITDYVSLPAGNHAIKVFPASADGTGTPVIDVPALTVESGKDYTVAAAGKVADIAPEVFVDNNAAPAANTAHVRVVHLSPDAPNVDIFAQGAGVVIPNLAFKAAANYLPLASGSYDLEVRAAGSSTAVLSLPDTNLEAGKVYTAFAIGLAGGDPALSVKLTTDATTSASPAATAAHLPTTGGAPAAGSSSNVTLIALAGLLLALVGLAAGGYTLVRQPARD
jgi:hypothetical protein